MRDFAAWSLTSLQPPFNNIKVRQAVLHAFDAREFLKGAYWGFGGAGHSLGHSEN